MKHIKSNAQTLVRDTDLSAGRSQNDTIRLWENYKDQAIMWRSLTLLQIPATLIAVLFAVYMWATRTITLSVPAKPLPGIYAAYDIPSTEFINVASDYINLIATYSPVVARRQYEEARKMLREPLLSKFDAEMMINELQAIESTKRSQMFYIDPTLTKVERANNEVKVILTGEREKLISGQQLPVVTSVFTVTLTTVPRNTLNPYGIVISSVEFDPDIRK